MNALIWWLCCFLILCFRLHFCCHKCPGWRGCSYTFLKNMLMFLRNCVPLSLSTHFDFSLPVSGVAYTEMRRPCRTMILVNPHSGRGQALQLFTGHIQGMLKEASVPYKLFITGQSETCFPHAFSSMVIFIWNRGLNLWPHHGMISLKTGSSHQLYTWSGVVAPTINLWQTFNQILFV